MEEEREVVPACCKGSPPLCPSLQQCLTMILMKVTFRILRSTVGAHEKRTDQVTLGRLVFVAGGGVPQSLLNTLPPPHTHTHLNSPGWIQEHREFALVRSTSGPSSFASGINFTRMIPPPNAPALQQVGPAWRKPALCLSLVHKSLFSPHMSPRKFLQPFATELLQGYAWQGGLSA